MGTISAEDKLILLVEDSSSDEALTLLALKRGGIANRVVVARDGVEALEFLFERARRAGREPNEMPVVVLLDLKLPKMDGLEVLRRLRADARTKLVPVVILTSSGEEKDVIAGYSQGANSFVRKPVDFGAFAEAIRQLGLYWVLLNEPLPISSHQ